MNENNGLYYNNVVRLLILIKWFSSPYFKHGRFRILYHIIYVLGVYTANCELCPMPIHHPHTSRTVRLRGFIKSKTKQNQKKKTKENDVRCMVNPMLDGSTLVFLNNMGIIMICAIICCKIKIFLG